jgi:Na+/proline symporter
MGIPVSILLIAGGAILAFAVDATSSAVNVHAIGWILMAAGLAGLVLSMILWDSWAGGGYYSRRRRTVAYDAPPAAPVGRRRVVREDVDETL